VGVGEMAGAEAGNAFLVRDALQRRPNLRELHDRRRMNVATSGRQRMRTGGTAPMPRLTYINVVPTR
jgi:hypothetical protein